MLSLGNSFFPLEFHPVFGRKNTISERSFRNYSIISAFFKSYFCLFLVLKSCCFWVVWNCFTKMKRSSKADTCPSTWSCFCSSCLLIHKFEGYLLWSKTSKKKRTFSSVVRKNFCDARSSVCFHRDFVCKRWLTSQTSSLYETFPLLLPWFFLFFKKFMFQTRVCLSPTYPSRTLVVAPPPVLKSAAPNSKFRGKSKSKVLQSPICREALMTYF